MMDSEDWKRETTEVNLETRVGRLRLGATASIGAIRRSCEAAAHHALLGCEITIC
ncbi:hypothetical protein BDM02DRAFT_2887212 [Thelephora ganbajun]|uniref:Uncharacterized protein n=1 Tax=Thelephora ganbajun TaxID=370292 RepID=A0ACB6ZAL6_THEGA|nr:hypothetical protein BDM02DRAFT_2887212 [Thelephora ganbajun]